MVTAINRMVKKSSSRGSSPSVSPAKELQIEEKEIRKEDNGSVVTEALNTPSPPSPGRIKRSWEVATQLCSSNAAILRERHPQLAASMDSVSHRTKEALQHLVPETWSPSKVGATVDNLVGDLRIKSATKRSWDVTAELLEKDVEPVVKHLELSVDTLRSNVGRLAASFIVILETLFKVTSQVADSFWQPLCFQVASPSTTQWERSWGSVSSLVQDTPPWKKFVGYMIRMIIFLFALPLALVRFIRYYFLNFDFLCFNMFSLVGLNTKVKKMTSEWMLFLKELAAFFHFMFGCFAVYVFEIVKDYRGPGSFLVKFIPKLLPKSLLSYIVEESDGQDTSRETDYNAEFASRDSREEESRRPNCTS